MKKLLLLVFLVSCQTPDPITVTQCTPHIIGEQQACFCRPYTIGPDYIGPVPGEKETEFPLNSCHKIIGYPIDDYLEVTEYLQKTRQKIEEIANKYKK